MESQKMGAKEGTCAMCEGKGHCGGGMCGNMMQGGCCGYGHHSWARRLIIGVVIAIFVFYAGVKFGEMRSYFPGSYMMRGYFRDSGEFPYMMGEWGVQSATATPR
jgi:hypothetical protein